MKKKVIPAIALGALLMAAHSEPAHASNDNTPNCFCPNCNCGDNALVYYHSFFEISYIVKLMIEDIMNIEEGTINDNDNLVKNLGMDSLSLFTLAYNIQEYFEIRCNIGMFLVKARDYTVQNLAEEILFMLEETYPCTYGSCHDE